MIHVMINNDGNDGGGLILIDIDLGVNCVERAWIAQKGKDYDESKKTYAPRMSLL